MTHKHEGSSRRTDHLSELLNGTRPEADERLLSDVLGANPGLTTDGPIENTPHARRDAVGDPPVITPRKTSPSVEPDPVIIAPAVSRSLSLSTLREDQARWPWSSTTPDGGVL